MVEVFNEDLFQNGKVVYHKHRLLTTVDAEIMK